MHKREQPSLERERRSERPPLQVGDWVVHPDLGVLRGGGGEVRLNPKSLQVLLVLIDAGNRGVSRDALLDAVWGASYPSDAVVSRAIADLRSAFGEKAGEQRYLRTLPKFGYQLVADVRPLPTEMTTADPSTGTASLQRSQDRRSRSTQIIAVVIGVAALVAMIVWLYPPVPNSGSEVDASADTSTLSLARPLTFGPGLEHQPRFSPQGDWVIYASKQPDRDDWDLYRTSIEDGGNLPVAVDTDVHEHGPAISGDGQQIAYARISSAGCEVVTQLLVLGEPATIATCTSRFPTVVDWSPVGDSVAYTNAASDDPEGRRRIYVVDIQTGAHRAVTDKVSDSGTDYYPRFSPSSAQLAFLRGEPQPDHRTTLWVTDLRTGAERLLHGPPTQLGGMTWQDDRTLVFAANEFGLWRLYQLNTDTGAQQLITAPQILHPELRSGSSELVASVVHRELDLVLIHDDGESPETSSPAQPVAQSTGDDHWGRLSPDGKTLALISTRSGSPELWLSDLGTSTTRRLTRFDGARVRYPNWHPDGTRLLFTVEGQRGERLHQVTLLTGEVKVLGPELAVTAPRWLGDADRWVADCEVQSNWQLCVGDGTEFRAVAPLMYRPQPLDAQAVVAVDDGGKLQRVDLASGTVTTLWDGLPGRGRFGWELRGDRLYYLRQAGASGEAQLVVRNLSSGFESVRFQDALPLADASISVNADRTQIVLSRYQSFSDDVHLFNLQ